MKNSSLTFDYLRRETIGVDLPLITPFGNRALVYCDFTASGRGLRFVEDYLLNVQTEYANTHTEDDYTGRKMTAHLHQAELTIKRSVNAGPDGRVIATGTGATGAIDKLQQILGISIPPATLETLHTMLANCFPDTTCQEFFRHMAQHKPVVFVGPYEHHSNEISWRLGLAEVVEVTLAKDGGVDLDHLEHLLQQPEYQGRKRIGSFSAASNVSGVCSPVKEIAKLLHRYDAIACFDYAASAPYVNIDMNPPADDEGDASIDAVFISPHKFLGGPGASGLLIFNKRLYQESLPPTVAAGGTVDYVNRKTQDFIQDIETREKAGTPGILQTIKAAVVFAVKDAVGIELIATREHLLIKRAMDAWSKIPHLTILGNPEPARRIGIISFNIQSPCKRLLHPKFVTTLLNDLFGIQSRAGCSCAGPYGHQLLDIDAEHSDQYRRSTAAGYGGLKPGWCRVGFHYTMDDIEADYVIAAVGFIARSGYRFLSLYNFDVYTGAWTHKQQQKETSTVDLASAAQQPRTRHTPMTTEQRRQHYTDNLSSAEAIANTLNAPLYADLSLKPSMMELQFFALDANSIQKSL